MTHEESTREPIRRTLWIEALITLLVGGGTWLFTDMFIESWGSDPQNGVKTDAIVLGFLVGGMTFLVQELTRFDRRIWLLEEEQERRLNRLEALNANVREAQERLSNSVQERLDDHFAKVSRASSLYALMEGSPFGSEIFEELGRYANCVGPETPYLLRELISQELRRLSDTVRQVGGNQGVWYEGEDREWLLTLAMSAQVSIDAVSLPVTDGGSRGFNDGLWVSDFGERYLEEQFNSITRRGVRVRRVFLHDRPNSNDALAAIRQRQAVKRVDVRVLRWRAIPQERQEDVSDFIIFDGKLLYELSPARIGLLPNTDVPEPPVRTIRLRTHLDVDQHVLDTKRGLFEFLWDLADGANAARDTEGPYPVGYTDVGHGRDGVPLDDAPIRGASWSKDAPVSPPGPELSGQQEE